MYKNIINTCEIIVVSFSPKLFGDMYRFISRGRGLLIMLFGQSQHIIMLIEYYNLGWYLCAIPPSVVVVLASLWHPCFKVPNLFRGFANFYPLNNNLCV